MQGFAGKVAVVTGAGSGMGAELAVQLGRAGASVAISDVDTEGLAVTEARLKAIGVKVKTDRLDVAERESFLLYADEVKANHGATVGQLDENVLFYLRSRGIPLDVARRMLVRAFCAVTLDGIKPAALREHCETLLAGQLPEVAA